MTDTEDSLLFETIPASLGTALHGLPRRLLFQNEHLQIVLVGFRRGQAMAGLRFNRPLVLAVVWGRVRVMAESVTILEEGQELRLEAAREYDLHAQAESDVVFFIPSQRAVEALAAARLKERLTASRRNETASARHLLQGADKETQTGGSRAGQHLRTVGQDK